MAQQKPVEPNKELLALTKRLNIIEGQVRGINKMLANEAYCIDVMKQIKAVKSSLEKVNTMVLKNHMETCVTTKMRSSNAKERETAIEEIVDIFNASGKL